MKRFCFLLLLTTCITLPSIAQKTGKLTITWEFKGVEEGYDHKNRIVVYIDGEEEGTSSSMVQTKKNSYTISPSLGNHDVRIVNWALYDGTWEEHTIANNYSVDCLWEDNIKIKKKTNVYLVFDLDDETTAKVK
jgi:hypothetical protein